MTSRNHALARVVVALTVVLGASRATVADEPPHVAKGRDERAAAGALGKLGAIINYGDYQPGDKIVKVSFNKKDAIYLKGLARNAYYEADFPPLADRDLEHVKGLQHLEELYLRETAVTDAGL